MRQIKIVTDHAEQIVLVEQIHHPIHFMVHAVFNDGYENIFFTDVETGQWIESDLGFTELAETLGKGAETFIKVNLQPKTLLWHTSSEENMFAYHKFEADGYPTYEIYGMNRRYLFTLVKLKSNDLWQVFKVPGQAKCRYNEDLPGQLCYILDNLML